MGSPKRARLLAVLVALFALSHPIVTLVCDLGAYADPSVVGLDVNAASGAVLSVRPGSNAALAGLRNGDRVDFTRTGPLMHLWLWDGIFPVGKPVTLPILRNGSSNIVSISAAAPPLDAAALTLDVAAVLFGIVVMTLACAAVFARTDSLTLSFYAFCIFYAAGGDNTAWLRISPPAITPISALESALPVVAGTIGFAFLCLRFPTGSPAGRWRFVDRALVPFGILIGLVYYLHFYQSGFITGTTASLYEVSSSLVVFMSVVVFIAYLSRFRGARGPELTRMRWVAAAITVYIVSLVLFFIDQIVNRSPTPTPWIIWLFKFNPAAFAFAYALVQSHVIDIRIAGGRALVYALVTSIPVALLAFADWLFARRLEDARLATVFEVGIAVGFSFWLRALHKRIDRFAERVFFAARHRAFQRVHHIAAALPFTERVATIESMLTEETAAALRFSSAALFRSEDGLYVRSTAVDWDGAAARFDADDPIALFTRSAHHGIFLSELPDSKAALPQGDRKPVYALPIVVGRRIIAVALYGAHLDGEAIDAEEEHLLASLAHAAATAYEHLYAVERERENAALRAELAALTPAAGTQ